jgi:hypothetical protein
LADETGDWNVKGDAEHKKKIESMNIPSVTMDFRKIHEDWYCFIWKTIPGTDRVKISLTMSFGMMAKSPVPRSYSALVKRSPKTFHPRLVSTKSRRAMTRANGPTEV